MAGSFQDYIDNKRPTGIETVLIGGFVPGQSIQTVLSEAAEAEDEDRLGRHVSKNPIMMNWKDTIWCCMHLPPEFGRRLLEYRYKEYVFWAKNNPGKVTSGSVVLNIGNRKIKTRSFEFDADELLNTIEKPVDYEKFRKMKPQDRAKYKGGLYGYSLDNKTENPETGEFIGDAYIGMQPETANRVMKDWRRGSAIGWLGEPKNMKLINLKAGRQTEDANRYFVNYHGNVFKQVPGKIWLPVFTGDELAKFDPKSVTDDGKFIWRYMENGSPKEQIDYVPKLLEGKLISAVSVRQYQESMLAFNHLLLQGKKQQAEKMIEHIQSYVQNAHRFDAFDFNVHQWNDSVDKETGQRVYDTLYTHNVKGYGTFNPNRNQKVQIQGSKEDRETAKKFFVGERNTGDQKNPRWKVLDQGDNWTDSAVELGVRKMLSSIKGSIEFYAMNGMLGDIIVEAMQDIYQNAGNPKWTEVFKALRGEKSSIKNTKELQMKRDLVFKEIIRKAFNFAQEVSQLNMGRGSRRRRGAFSVTSINKQGGEEGETYEVGGKQVTGAMAEPANSPADIHQAIELYKYKRQRGERKETRRPGEVKQIHWAHDIEQIRTRIQELAQEASAVATKPDAEDISSKEKMDKQLNIRVDMFENILLLFFKDKIRQNDFNWKMEEAIAWAEQQLSEYLRAQGIVVSDGIGKGIEPTPATKAELDFMKKEVEKHAGMIKDANEDFIFSKKQIQDLMNKPELLQTAIDMAQQEQGEVRTDVLDVLTQIKQRADEIRGKATGTKPVALHPLLRHAMGVDELERIKNKFLDPRALEAMRKSPQLLEKLKQSAAEYPGVLGPVLQKIMADLSAGTGTIPVTPTPTTPVTPVAPARVRKKKI